LKVNTPPRDDDPFATCATSSMCHQQYKKGHSDPGTDRLTVNVRSI